MTEDENGSQEDRRLARRLARYAKWAADQRRPVKFASWNSFSGHNGVAAIELNARDWVRWFLVALNHRRAALLLWDDFVAFARQPPVTPGLFPATVGEQAVLSMGFSIENLLKGIIASDQSKPVVQTNGKIHHRIATHDLCDLVEEAGLSLTHDGWEEFLDVLSSHVEGNPGRYPIPAEVGSPRVVQLILNPAFLAYYEEMFATVGTALLEQQQGLYPPKEQDRCTWARESVELHMQSTAPRAATIPPRTR